MDDSHHHHHHHQYGITDLRQLINGGGSSAGGIRLTSPSSPSSTSQMNNIPSDLFGFNLALGHHQYHHQEMNFVTRGDSGLQGMYTPQAPDSSNVNGNGVGGFGGLLDGGGTGRWPRQETLTLLEIRSRLDHKFKEANQKGPLWDEVSRILSEEHGYHRSGKKCREKFENLYKYYKKTKEGKAGRQDGKHYRFFRQLEALYGDSSHPVPCPEAQFMGNNFHFHAPILEAHNGNQEEALNNLNQKISMEENSLSLSNFDSTELNSSSSDDNQTIDSMTKKRRRRRNWKAKIKDFIDSQMKKLVERQETWLEKLTKTIEEKEQERRVREELWRKQESLRVERERRFWAKEKEWMESRDANLVETLQNLTGRRILMKASSNNSSEQEQMINNLNNENANDDQTVVNHYLRVKAVGTPWTESEIARLIELRTSMGSRFEQAVISGCSDEVLWEEISANMCFAGNEPGSALLCKEKWECLSNYVRMKNKEPDKKQSREFSIPGRITNGENGYNCNQIDDLRSFRDNNNNNNNNNEGSSTSNSNIGNNGCFPFLLGDGDF